MEAAEGSSKNVAGSDTSADVPLSLTDIKETRKGRKHDKANQGGRSLSPGLLAKRTTEDFAALAPEAIRRPLNVVINLDGEQLNDIPLELCREIEPVARLNLKQNCFVEMKFLSTLTNLQSLSLAHNSVAKVSGIRGLTKLVELDLTNNLITDIDVDELPQSIQKLQLQNNPVGLEQPELLAKLLAHLTSLQRLNDSSIDHPSNSILDPSNSSSTGSAGSTNEMVEAALKELHIEHVVLGNTRLGDLVTKSPLWPAASPFTANTSSSPILVRSNSRVAVEGPPSPVRVTLSTSRQGSFDLSSYSSGEALEVLARVRDALPKVREASDLGFNSLSDALAVHQDRRSHSSDCSGYTGFRRTSSDGTRNVRAISLPHSSKGSLHPRLSLHTAGSSKDGHRFPLLATPTSYAEKPAEFQNLLSAAISTLVGSSGPPREVAFTSSSEEVSVWAQGQHHRQQVLDSLFAKRRGKLGMLHNTGNSRKGLGERLEEGKAPKGKGRAPLRRADSTISKHRRSGHGGISMNEEMLKGLGLRDAPRAEGLSEALQGPPTQTPGEQLAALSQSPAEKHTAEQVRMSLRRGVERMLDNVQQQRELEPSNVAAMVSELNKLKQMKSLQSLLAVREGHMPPQPQVLASIVGAHSRLGSITERLAQSLPILPVLDTEPIPHASTGRSASVQQIGMGAGLTSPFAAPPETGGSKAPPESGNPSQRQFLKPRASNASVSSSSSSSETASSTAGSAQLQRQMTQAMPSSMRPSGEKPGGVLAQRNPSQRRMRPSQPSSPSSDAEMDPEPPVDRQSSRPIFGGIAKMVRNPSGQMELPPSPIPSASRAPSGRIHAGKMQLSNKMGTQKSSPFGGSGAVLNLKSTSTTSSESDQRPYQLPPRGSNISRAHTLHPGSIPEQPESSVLGRESTKAGGAEQRCSVKGSEEGHGNAELRSAVIEAGKQRDKVQSELWDRFSGGGGLAAKQLQPRSAGEGGKKSVVFSPFSVVNDPASSPFSHAPTAPRETTDNRQELQARGKSWHSGELLAVSPFAGTALPHISRPAPNPTSPNVQGGQSAPPIPASEITLRQEEAKKREMYSESYSAPPEDSLRQVLGEAVAAHLKEQAKRTEAAKEGEQIGEVLAENVSEASGGLPSGEGSLGATKGGNEPPTASVETSTASAEASTFSAGSLASSHLSVPPKEGPTKSPFA